LEAEVVLAVVHLLPGGWSRLGYASAIFILLPAESSLEGHRPSLGYAALLEPFTEFDEVLLASCQQVMHHVKQTRGEYFEGIALRIIAWPPVYID
jgi:hypothetical protein